MKEKKIYKAIGLMSGTSLDGVDAAILETDGYDFVKPGAFLSVPYSDEEREIIRAAFGLTDRGDARVKQAEQIVTDAHIKVVKQLGLEGVELIGFHGQTIHHDPDNRVTMQIGDGKRMARELGVSVVADFRSADVAAGGQGAPLLPLYHRARVRSSKVKLPVVILNIGGVANITYIGHNKILAFDTGPGNALMDDFMKVRTGKLYDEDGKLAAEGEDHFELYLMDHKKLAEIEARWQAHPFFRKKPPKSLDRDVWSVSELEGIDLPTARGMAFLLYFTEYGILQAQKFFPRKGFFFKDKPRLYYVTGGGRKNKTLMDLLTFYFKKVYSVDDLGWNGDALEAEGFAYLAVRSLLSEPISLPTTTGVPRPMTGGKTYFPENFTIP